MRFGRRPSSFGDRDGVALVITLIMLAIITFMAITFLVLSQRERSSVSTAMDQKTARNASDAALARVSTELLTRIMMHTNFQDFDLLTSTNYYNPIGLFPGVPGTLSPTNVNYFYLVGHTPITDQQDRNINIASLLFNPRPPVFVVTNAGTGEAEFRYYYDANRNGRFDPNGNWPVVVVDTTGNTRYVSTNAAGQYITVSTNLPIPPGTWLLTNTFVGDPEWIGVLERPEELHSADNRFIARYAYIVVPIGKALDINTMHNESLLRAVNPAAGPPLVSDGYLRNQGTGPWDLNLAAFLADLNTNIWNANPLFPQNYYQYNEADPSSPTFGPNKGIAFDDARALLSYRYGNSYANLAPAANIFPTAGLLLRNDGIDEYSDGPRMLTTSTNEALLNDDPTLGWPGAENPNHYFTTQDLFDRAKTQAGFGAGANGFSVRLQQAGGSNDTYNAYTFYRMLAQLGTDSPEEVNKLNINYKNTDVNGHIVPGMETNMIPWTAEDFFTNAANRILAQFTNDMGVPLSTAYIPLYPTNYYTPAVHRALQLAANIFDATTNQTVPLLATQTNALFPSVFRPIFTSQDGKVWISGYREVVDLTPLNNFQWWDLNTASNSPGVYPFLNIYGVPWVVGAKKGWPNFNKFASETDFQLTRKLELIRQTGAGTGTANPSDFTAKQSFNMTILHTNGLQAWNSYGSDWPMTTRPLRLFTTNIFTVRILNSTNVGAVDMIPYSATAGGGANLLPASWGKYRQVSSQNLRSQISVGPAGFEALDGNNYSYHAAIPGFRFGTNYDQTVRPIPQFYIVTTNRIVYALIDVNAQRIVDFVNLDDSGKIMDFTAALMQTAQCNASGNSIDPGALWCTNPVTGAPVLPDAVSQGLNYQVQVNLGNPTVNGWNTPGTPGYDQNNQGQIDNFRILLLNSQNGATNQTPYNPVFGVTNRVSWEANDPLVHYTIPDLTDQNSVDKWNFDSTTFNLNHRYLPWNIDLNNADSDNLPTSASKKDPMAVNSDAWDFPTNKFWNVGILGRVHRGTPWQTIYMKSPILPLKDWQNWSGSTVIDTNAANNNIFVDAALSSPTNDYALFDVFTTVVSPSASRGKLNINQTNLAAWSAVFSGVSVLTNANASALGTQQIIGPAIIPPAGVYNTNNPTPMAQIWMGINRARANTDTNSMIFPNRVFQHLGDVLATPELTVGSPYINKNWAANDEVYERIPQQIMSLLTLNQTPRFVIYSFGQTLHPADHSLVIGGTFNGLCTNYQITAESAVRAVVRLEGTPDPKYVNGRVDSHGRSYPPHLVVEQYNVIGPD